MAVHRRFTDRSDGDLRIDGDPEALAARRAAIVDLPWLWLRQVHGAEVVTVTTADEVAALAGTEADAAVTTVPGVVLAIHTADCVPVLFTSPQGVIGAAHAGWKGIEAGVLARTVEAMQALGATQIEVAVGPHIHPGCYEFGEPELERLVATVGRGVRARTSAGTPALDLLAAVGHRLVDEADLTVIARGCTACAVADDGRPQWYSHRARADAGRQASLIWLSS